MNHLDNAAKFKEEKVLCDEPFKLCRAEEVYLTTPPINHTATTMSLSVKDSTHKGLCPKTPNPNQESIEKPCDAKTSSPSSTSSPPQSTDCSDSSTIEADSSDDGSPKTPKSVFDPFAPGPEEMGLAPICKKVAPIPWKFTPRRLNFDDCDECLEIRNPDCEIETISEEMVLESVYTAILEAVIKMQTEAFVAARKNLPSLPAMAKTPPGRKLKGKADICPNAPMKTAPSKLSNIEIVRRKLEF